MLFIRAIVVFAMVMVALADNLRTASTVGKAKVDEAIIKAIRSKVMNKIAEAKKKSVVPKKGQFTVNKDNKKPVAAVTKESKKKTSLEAYVRADAANDAKVMEAHVRDLPAKTMLFPQGFYVGRTFFTGAGCDPAQIMYAEGSKVGYCNPLSDGTSEVLGGVVRYERQSDNLEVSAVFQTFDDFKCGIPQESADVTPYFAPGQCIDGGDSSFVIDGNDYPEFYTAEGIMLYRYPTASTCKKNKSMFLTSYEFITKSQFDFIGCMDIGSGYFYSYNCQQYNTPTINIYDNNLCEGTPVQTEADENCDNMKDVEDFDTAYTLTCTTTW